MTEFGFSEPCPATKSSIFERIQKCVLKPLSRHKRTIEAATYCPLNFEKKETRLLHLEPGTSNDPISYHFHVISMQTGLEIPGFEAISYCWDQKARQRVVRTSALPSSLTRWPRHEQPSGHRPEQGQDDFEIPSSAIEVLMRLRQPRSMRLVWIDAICINQQSLQERSEQVSIMHLIYINASRTVAWLGHDDGTARSAVRSIKSIVAAGRASANYTSFNEWHFAGNNYYDLQLPVECDYRALDAFYARGWHSRVWIQQEVFLASSCLCMIGGAEIDWLEVGEAAFWITHRTNFDDKFESRDNIFVARALREFEASRSEGGYLVGLYQILSHGLDLHCTDPKDKVFGMLAITRMYQNDLERSDRGLITDYRKTVQDIFRDITRLTIEEDQDLSILTYCSRIDVEPVEGGYCSWSFRPGELRTTPPLLYERAMTSGKHLEILIKDCTTLDPNILSVGGIVADTVQRILPRFSFAQSDVMAALNIFDTILGHPFGATITSRPCWLESVSNVLTGGKYHGSLSTTIATEFTSSLQVIGSLLNENETYSLRKRWNAMKLTYDAETVENFRSYCNSVCNQCQDRKICFTEQNRLALIPCWGEEGDIITVLYGCKWPCLLGKQGNSYMFIGLCWVDGIMDGEIVEAHEAQGLPPEIFALR